MKNLAHPHMFPGVSSDAVVDGALPETAPKEAVVTDADVGGIAATPAPATAWANPLLPKVLSELGDDHSADSSHRITWALRVADYLKNNGPSSSSALCAAFALDPAVGINPYVKSAIVKGVIVRDGKLYALPDQLQAPSADASTVEQKPAPEPAKALPKAISHFEKATAIVAMRKQIKTKEVAPAEPTPVPTPAPAPAPAPAETPATPDKVGRKPLLVVSVGELQLLAWAGGGITIQTEDASIELEAIQTRALLVLAELHS